MRASATRYTQKARRAQTQSQTLLSRCQERLLIYLTELAGMQHVPTQLSGLSPQPHHAHPHVGRTRHIPVHRARERAPPPREIPTHGPTKENPLSLLRRTGRVIKPRGCIVARGRAICTRTRACGHALTACVALRLAMVYLDMHMHMRMRSPLRPAPRRCIYSERAAQTISPPPTRLGWPPHAPAACRPPARCLRRARKSASGPARRAAARRATWRRAPPPAVG